ncbi:S-Ena type endospore appendage [Peribacillus butanolivorans]
MSEPIVCNSTCGNLLLTDQVPSLEIWKARIAMDATVTISVFNSAMSTASVRVLVIRNAGSPVEFSVPSGNTLSATVDAAESIIVFRIDTGRTEGKYFLEVCFPVICDDKRKQKKDK